MTIKIGYDEDYISHDELNKVNLNDDIEIRPVCLNPSNPQMSLSSDAYNLLIIVAPFFKDIVKDVVISLASDALKNYISNRRYKVIANKKPVPMDGSIAINSENKQIEIIPRANKITKEQWDDIYNIAQNLKNDGSYILIIDLDGKIRVAPELQYFIEKSPKK